LEVVTRKLIHKVAILGREKPAQKPPRKRAVATRAELHGEECGEEEDDDQLVQNQQGFPPLLIFSPPHAWLVASQLEDIRLST
jgi:hypothetical protein